MTQILKIDPSYIPLLTSAQAAALVGLSRSSLNKMRVYGSGPNFCKLGRTVRYRRDDLAAWVAGRIVTSTSDDSLPRRLRDCPAAAKPRPRHVAA
jgi:predicted DNA-binding transcriptional regulator AlpA